MIAGQRLPRRCVNCTGWLVPAAILAVLPKCPLCLAMYLAMGTGVSISLVGATYLRLAVMVVCVVALVWMAAGRQRAPARREVMGFR